MLPLKLWLPLRPVPVTKLQKNRLTVIRLTLYLRMRVPLRHELYSP